MLRSLGIWIALPMLLVGCSGEVEEGDHVWREQTQTLDKAQGVEQTLQQGLQQQMRQVDEGR